MYHRSSAAKHFNPRSPCGERRQNAQQGLMDQNHFNPRSPCGERHHRFTWRLRSHQFQSTLPVWGATKPSQTSSGSQPISIHAPRVGSDREVTVKGLLRSISIHAPRVGSDRGRCAYPRRLRGISIHAPRVGSDRRNGGTVGRLLYFNPRSPCGERPGNGSPIRPSAGFQSTLPVGGATR
mgnify:CR=1 FL=1